MTTLHDSLRQMIAVLQAERQALAGFDLEGILGAAADKRELCGRIDDSGMLEIDAECRAMLETAQRLNEVNRQIRNLIAANVAARLDALTGAPQTYRPARLPAYASLKG